MILLQESRFLLHMRMTNIPHIPFSISGFMKTFLIYDKVSKMRIIRHDVSTGGFYFFLSEKRKKYIHGNWKTNKTNRQLFI